MLRCPACPRTVGELSWPGRELPDPEPIAAAILRVLDCWSCGGALEAVKP